MDQFHNLQLLEIDDCPILSARLMGKTKMMKMKIKMEEMHAIKIKYEEKKGK
ncbi:uncharacterized protein DS421_12g355510 [Arachis hypogaea]|nr:uncharacterized protein DS421_12g355510 [Arachis hypogaea]